MCFTKHVASPAWLCTPVTYYVKCLQTVQIGHFLCKNVFFKIKITGSIVGFEIPLENN